MIDISRAPFPITVRELWLPRAINGNATLPSSRYNGHPLALTGARKGSTADGVRGDGSATSNINCGAIHDNAATLWLSFRFRFDQPYGAGSGDQYIWGKFLDATHFLWLVFKTADGKLYFEGQDGGGNDFSIAAQDGAADITSWEAGRWYHVLASISAANDVRFRIDNGTVVTVVTAIAAPNGGDFVILDFDDPGAGTGFEGDVADPVVGTADITAAQETDLSRGIPPANAVNFWPLDEGRGVTVYDRGTGGNNGTLDTSCTWAFGACKQPVLSLDGINDRGLSSAGVDISNPVTMLWVAKMKSTYDSLIGHHLFCRLLTPPNDYLDFQYRIDGNYIRFRVGTAATFAQVTLSAKPAIDDYWILIGTVTAGGQITLHLNGSPVGTSTGVEAIAPGALAYIGSDPTPALYDISKPLLIGLFDTAFTAKQASAFSRWLNEILSMGIAI